MSARTAGKNRLAGRSLSSESASSWEKCVVAHASQVQESLGDSRLFATVARTRNGARGGEPSSSPRAVGEVNRTVRRLPAQLPRNLPTSAVPTRERRVPRLRRVLAPTTSLAARQSRSAPSRPARRRLDPRAARRGARSATLLVRPATRVDPDADAPLPGDERAGTRRDGHDRIADVRAARPSRAARCGAYAPFRGGASSAGLAAESGSGDDARDRARSWHEGASALPAGSPRAPGPPPSLPSAPAAIRDAPPGSGRRRPHGPVPRSFRSARAPARPTRRGGRPNPTSILPRRGHRLD